jgi:hypothetical protein
MDHARTKFKAGFEFSLDILATNCYFGMVTMAKLKMIQLANPKPSCMRVPCESRHTEATG